MHEYAEKLSQYRKKGENSYVQGQIYNSISIMVIPIFYFIYLFQLWMSLIMQSLKKGLRTSLNFPSLTP
jgi:hypothetical protein